MNHSNGHQPFYKSIPASGWVAIAAVLGAATYYLLAYHKKHALDVLPYLLVIVMILMHGFMHGGHGGHNNQKGNHG